MGARQFVVQEALDTTLWLALSYSVWFTPHTSRLVYGLGLHLNIFHPASNTSQV